MRILMLAQSYAPVVGGEERVVEELSRELLERGHEVSVATLALPGVEPVQSDDVRIHTLGSSSYRFGVLRRDAERRHAPPGPDPEAVADLREVVREERPEIVHAHNWLIHSYLPVDRRRGASLVLSLHDYSLICATKRLFYKGEPCSGPGPVKCVRCAAAHYGAAKGGVAATGTLSFQRQVRRHVDVFLPVSSAVERLCRLRPQDRSRVIPNFVGSLPEPPLDDPRLAQLPQGPFVLYFGDVTDDKGAWELAEAYRDLVDPPPLVMVGRCYLKELRDRPNVHVLGSWPHGLAIEALRRSLFSVAPSLWPEPFGLVALEAAAAGKPVVASNIGGLPDIVVHEETGLLVPPGDRAGLTAALRRMLEEPGLRERLGAAASERVAQFGPDAIVPRFEEAYELALEARRPRVHSPAG